MMMQKASRSGRIVLLLAGLMVGLIACLPLSTPLPPLPTDTPLAPTGTPTPTTVWFPPTATYTPLPMATLSITPTLDLRPQYGALVLTDDFTDPEKWILGRTGAGSIALGKNELTLAVSQERGYLFSLLRGVALSNFYLEITASPSICRGSDEYGLLLRVSPGLDFFRFSLTCNGQARVDRVLGSQASSPIPPSFNGVVPPGAPSSSRLGIWAWGKEMRFYANGQYLFTVRDSSLPGGNIGVFARASGPDAVTVNFSDLAVYEILK